MTEHLTGALYDGARGGGVFERNWQKLALSPGQLLPGVEGEWEAGAEGAEENLWGLNSVGMIFGRENGCLKKLWWANPRSFAGG